MELKPNSKIELSVVSKFVLVYSWRKKLTIKLEYLLLIIIPIHNTISFSKDKTMASGPGDDSGKPDDSAKPDTVDTDCGFCKPIRHAVI